MPLSLSRIGEITTIKRITGNGETRRHLENLGFLVGEPVSIVSSFAGNLILSIKNTRIALDRSMASRIIV